MPKGIQNICTGLPDLIQEVWETHVLLEWFLETVASQMMRPQVIQPRTPGSISAHTEIGTFTQPAGPVLLSFWLFGSRGTQLTFR